MLGIHRNPDWKECLKSCECFLRKSQFSILTDLNPGFGGPWNMLGIFFVNVVYITSKEVFWPKKVLNSIHGFKSAICQNWKITKIQSRASLWRWAQSYRYYCYKWIAMTLNLPLTYFVWTEEYYQTSLNKNKSPNLCWHIHKKHLSVLYFWSAIYKKAYLYQLFHLFFR